MSELAIAPPWKRFVAYIFDMLILASTSVAIGIVLYKIYPIGDEDAFTTMVDVVLALLYYLIFWTACSTTPGKMLLGLRIERVAGGKMGFGRSLARFLGYYVSLLGFGLGFFWILFDKRRQGWHDKMVGTVVIQKRPLEHVGDGKPDRVPS